MHASATTRREFLRTSTAAAAGVALSTALPRPGYTAESNTLKVALIGCGGRGTGAAAQALSTAGPTQLWALADAFDYRVRSTADQLEKRFPDKATVPPERRFAGLDGFRKVMDSMDPGSVVLLATPPAFRPQHLEYAVQKGLHVFMEKSFAVDAPGIRRVLRAGEAAQAKNLKVAAGLMSRHSVPLAEAIQRVHDGAIGELITCWAYRMHGPVGFSPRGEGQSELAHQITNYSNFTWLNGSFLVDWLIHNIDVCCWAKNAWPVSAQGMGGRQVRREPDQLWDHYAAEYTFPDGTRMFAQGRHQSQCFDFFGDVLHGTTGCGVLGEGIPDPKLYKGHKPDNANLLYRYRGPASDPYQNEHDKFFAAIRSDQPYNETERAAKSCFTAIMGRMACDSGKALTWDEALQSPLELAPGLDTLTLASAAPVRADASGQYPIAMPGVSPAL
jgi:predicted dehydrogenase